MICGKVGSKCRGVAGGMTGIRLEVWKLGKECVGARILNRMGFCSRQRGHLLSCNLDVCRNLRQYVQTISRVRAVVVKQSAAMVWAMWSLQLKGISCVNCMKGSR
jgi:hypothetical protein